MDRAADAFGKTECKEWLEFLRDGDIARMNAPMPLILQHDADAWALRINASWRRSFESTIEAGQLLIDAKGQLPHGQFEKMIEAELDFSASTAQRLMIVARDHRLTNPAHGQLLPRSARTLYELSKLTDEQFSYGVEHKIITPDMERKDVELIRPTPHRAQESQSESNQRQTASTDEGSAPGLRVGEAVAVQPATSEFMDVTAGETAPNSAPMPSGGLAIAHPRQPDDDPREFFPTPLWATRALFEHVLPHLGKRGQWKFQKAWEPACGEGHMAEVLKEYFPDVFVSDKYPYDYPARECDFITDGKDIGADWVITNPPFRPSTDFVLKALSVAHHGVAMFVRLTWLESAGRFERIFTPHPPTLISIFSERVPLHKGRWESDGVTMTAYVWLVWIKGAEPRAPFWIPPICRKTLTRPDDAKRFGAPQDDDESEAG
jgi:DUF3102 family protein